MTRLARLFPAALLVLAAACTQPAVPEDHFYRLGSAPAQGGGTALAGVIEVNRFVADGLTGRRPVVYTDNADAREVRAYHYHFWSEPPPILL